MRCPPVAPDVLLLQPARSHAHPHLGSLLLAASNFSYAFRPAREPLHKHGDRPSPVTLRGVFFMPENLFRLSWILVLTAPLIAQDAGARFEGSLPGQDASHSNPAGHNPASHPEHTTPANGSAQDGSMS